MSLRQQHADHQENTKKAGVKLYKEGYNNNPLDGVPQVLGGNAVTDVYLNPGLKTVARFLATPASFAPGLVPFTIFMPKFSPHTKPYKGMKAYGNQVGNAVKDSVKNLIKRIT